MKYIRNWSPGRRAVLIGLLLLIPFAAVQWFLYDWTHHQAEHFSYYLGTCTYFLGVLTPAAVILSFRWPFSRKRWKLRAAQHLLGSLALTSLAVVFETGILCRLHNDWAFVPMLRHCFTYHLQPGILAYWAVLGAAHAYRRYDQSRERELTATRLESQLNQAHLTSLRSQLQPHFLFNTLQAAIVLIPGDPDGAEQVLLSLSALLRSSLHTLDATEVPLAAEIEFAKHYAAIQQRRFGDRLRFDFQIDVSAEGCAVPSLLLQPLVENAIHHGINRRKSPDVVSVRARVDRDTLLVEIQNETGVLDADLEDLLARGVGLSNTMARLALLYGKQCSFKLLNLSPRGVLASLSIPAHAATFTAPQKVTEPVS